MNTNIICNALIHILILILFFTFFINNKNDTNSVIFILVVTVVFVCYLLEFVRKPKLEDVVENNSNNNRITNEKYKNENLSNNLTIIQNKFNELKNKVEENNKNNVVEHFSAPLDHKIGPYDGETMNNDKSVHELETNYENENCGWRKKPCNVPLLTNMGFVAPTGEELKYQRLNKPDNDGNPYQLDLNLPSVTGDKNDPKAMFMFAHNQSHPDCCPSTYSTSTGCVCVTKKQADHLSKRGGNQKNDLYPGI